ncbi:MAG TPA: hypothetical protein QGH84_02895 [Rhodospirillales bacterium]|nr:hypothetical protein [Rhodospirillales bacterium]
MTAGFMDAERKNNLVALTSSENEFPGFSKALDILVGGGKLGHGLSHHLVRWHSHAGEMVGHPFHGLRLAPGKVGQLTAFLGEGGLVKQPYGQHGDRHGDAGHDP